MKLCNGSSLLKHARILERQWIVHVQRLHAFESERVDVHTTTCMQTSMDRGCLQEFKLRVAAVSCLTDARARWQTLTFAIAIAFRVLIMEPRYIPSLSM